jgi:pyruvate dehydrogenase E2 component (dihydrolipoamide acetyltransferase)
MDEGRIVSWHKREGDAVTQGEALFEVETDKVTMDVEAPTSGYVRRIVVHDDETVPVATVVAVVADTLEEPIDAALPSANAAEAPAAAATAAAPAAGPAPAAPAGDRVTASPAARKRAAELGVDLADVEGSGPGGRIQIEDVERAAAGPPR